MGEKWEEQLLHRHIFKTSGALRFLSRAVLMYVAYRQWMIVPLSCGFADSGILCRGLKGL